MSEYLRVLVTGGAGYLGSILVPHLLAAEHEVTVIDNFMHRQVSLGGPGINDGFELVRGDARDLRVLTPLLKKCDVFIPLAAIVGAPACDADLFAATTTNFEAIDTACRVLSQDQWVIAPISNSGYGVGGKYECTEDTPMHPVSLYGKTKVQAEKLILSRKNSVLLRLATVFGWSPRMRMDLLVNDFVYRAVTDRAITLFEPHFRRCYIHVRDVAYAFEHVIDNFEKMRGKPYNVGLSDSNLSKLQLCERISAYVPDFAVSVAQNGQDPDKRDYVVSNVRIEAAGFKPQHSLDDGIRELVKGYRQLWKTPYGNV